MLCSHLILIEPHVWQKETSMKLTHGRCSSLSLQQEELQTAPCLSLSAGLPRSSLTSVHSGHAGGCTRVNRLGNSRPHIQRSSSFTLLLLLHSGASPRPPCPCEAPISLNPGWGTSGLRAM